MTDKEGGGIRPQQLRQAGEGIFYTDQPFVFADRSIIAFLKEQARSVPRKRARLCAHPAPESEQHDMLIVSHRDTYVAPHRHLRKSETFLVLEGFAEAILFDERGVVTETLAMGPAESGRVFFYRMPPGRFHSLRIESELLVFVESTKGPFRAEETENAHWAPDPQDALQGRRYVEGLAAGACG